VQYPKCSSNANPKKSNLSGNLPMDVRWGEFARNRIRGSFPTQAWAASCF
jgi:hypothetical protein